LIGGAALPYRFATCGDLFSVRSCLSDCVQFQKERAAYAFSARRANEQRHNALQLSTSNNFIDDYVFGKMVNDGVESAPLATDAEIVRRLSVDLTGRIPSPELVA